MKIVELQRYPVKSMAGEKLERAELGFKGIIGDRGWALRDEAAGEIRGAKKLPRLLECRARYLQQPGEDHIPPAEIVFPDGGAWRSDDPRASELLSVWVGRQVTLWPRQPAENLEHYRRGLPDNPDLMVEIRELFGRTESEPLPDFSSFPPEVITYATPPGTYFDAFPIHLVTTSTLAELAEHNPKSRFDVRRFRPNIVVDTGPLRGFVEHEWNGKTLRVGRARLRVEMACPRCVMTTLPQADLPKDPLVLRTIVRDAEQNVGTYLTVTQPGEVAVGDEVVLA